VLKITFTADTSDMMEWKFKPQQNNVKVIPGETALAFYKATNPSKVAITGVATYNVFPPKAGLYFNKIQCFCFEEQRLRPGEEIDMPVGVQLMCVSVTLKKKYIYVQQVVLHSVSLSV
jgi:cytochrome c oxidase assembly protein subunit 11